MGHARAHGYRLIDAYEVAEQIDGADPSPVGDALPAPPSERVARELARLKASPDLIPAWRAVVDQHEDDGPITAPETKRVLVGAGPFIPDSGA